MGLRAGLGVDDKLPHAYANARVDALAKRRGFRTASLANDRSGKGAVHSLEGAAEGLQVLPWLFAYQCQPDVSAFV